MSRSSVRVSFPFHSVRTLIEYVILACVCAWCSSGRVVSVRRAERPKRQPYYLRVYFWKHKHTHNKLIISVIVIVAVAEVAVVVISMVSLSS